MFPCSHSHLVISEASLLCADLVSLFMEVCGDAKAFEAAASSIVTPEREATGTTDAGNGTVNDKDNEGSAPAAEQHGSEATTSKSLNAKDDGERLLLCIRTFTFPTYCFDTVIAGTGHVRDGPLQYLAHRCWQSIQHK